MGTSKIRDMSRCALAAAVMAVCAWITVPGPVPFTLQTLGLLLTLELLGGRLGVRAIAVYLGLGLLGLPVFSGFRGGPGVLLGATGGYLSGFLLSGYAWWALKRLRLSPALAGLVALAVCYTFGTGWYAIYTGSAAIGAILAACVYPFILPELGKLCLALVLSRRLKPHIHE